MADAVGMNLVFMCGRLTNVTNEHTANTAIIQHIIRGQDAHTSKITV